MEIKLMLKSKRMIEDVGSLMEDMLPLNIAFTVSIMYNQHQNLEKYTYDELSQYTHTELRESINIGG